MYLSASYEFLPRQLSVHATQVMDHFGISLEQGRHCIAENLELPIVPGSIVLLTGASGSGKSSLLRAVVEQLRGPSLEQAAVGETPTFQSAQESVIALEELPLPDSLLIDALGLPAPESMNLLSSCGLGEAHLMLRRPSELSEGQRYRFRLALALSRRPQWIVADEFTATLDRTLARVIAFNLRRQAGRTGIGFLLATTHEDVAADLAPDVHVQCHLDGSIQVHEPGKVIAGAAGENPTLAGEAGKKKESSPFTTNSGFLRRPDATGRTSLGGITAAIRSV